MPQSSARQPSKHVKNGMTRADAEMRGDTGLLQNLSRAEERSGFRTGLRLSEEGPQVITVRFYPEPMFWICASDLQGNPQGDPRRLTPEIYADTWSILEGRCVREEECPEP